MNEFVIEARFTGKNGSRGYCTGERYRLRVCEHTGQSPLIEIGINDFSGWCPYESFYSFLQNWTDIHFLEGDTRLIKR